ncbi:phosphoglycerate mutase family protein [Streptococcus equi subsp. zooepidemicus]|nr:phosphoglycerate mutase family protein [Streptococcus equi subsp. zooepidemicus]
MTPNKSKQKVRESMPKVDMMTQVYFIRHAEPNYQNHNDVTRELSEHGIRVSQDLVRQLAEVSIDAFYSSPYKRSIDTIAPLAASREKKIKLVDDLRERKLADAWIEDFVGTAKRQWDDFTFKLPTGESLQEVQARNIAALNRILKESRGKAVVIGTHGTALSTIINYYQPDFGFEDFNRCKHVFPWIVRASFDGDQLLGLNEFLV